MEQLANFQADTTLNMPGDLDATTTTIVVTSLTGFPSSYPYRIRMDNELLKVTGSPSSLHLTVVRGDGGTTGAIHLNGADLAVVLTKEALDAIVTIQLAGTEVASRRILNFTSGTVTDDGANNRINIAGGGGSSATVAATASRPSAGTSGNIFVPNDGEGIQVDNGSIWVPYGPLYRLTVPPVVSAWTQVNFGGLVTFSDSVVGPFMVVPSGSPGVRLAMIAAPSTPYTITAAFLCQLPVSASARSAGLHLRDSVGGKVLSFAITCSGGLFLTITQWNSVSSFSSNVNQTQFGWVAPLLFFRIHDDGTNRTYSISTDGINFVQQYTDSHTNWLTPNQIGWGFYNDGANYQFGMTLISWLQGT